MLLTTDCSVKLPFYKLWGIFPFFFDILIFTLISLFAAFVGQHVVDIHGFCLFFVSRMWQCFGYSWPLVKVRSTKINQLLVSVVLKLKTHILSLIQQPATLTSSADFCADYSCSTNPGSNFHQYIFSKSNCSLEMNTWDRVTLFMGVTKIQRIIFIRCRCLQAPPCVMVIT